MRKFVMLVLVGSVVSVVSVRADEAKPDAPAKSLAASSKPAASKDGWLTSLEDAKAESAKRNVPILADFSGSDWCGWCMKLEKEVFTTPEFKEYASKNLVLLLVDFPHQKHQSPKLKKQNKELAEQFNVDGFPTVVLLDAKGKELGRTGYRPGGGESYVKHLQQLLQK